LAQFGREFYPKSERRELLVFTQGRGCASPPDEGALCAGQIAII
jgi:hypothetical protein